MSHTPEPWRVESNTPFSLAKEIMHGKSELTILVSQPQRHQDIAYIAYCATDEDNSEQQANAARIVAAVNACQGLSTDWLTEHAGRYLADHLLGGVP